MCWSVSLENDQSVGVSSLFTLVLPHSKHRWITTAIILSVERRGEEEEERGRGNVYHLVCGDRKGSIHYYCVNDWKKEKNNPRQVMVLYITSSLTLSLSLSPYLVFMLLMESHSCYCLTICCTVLVEMVTADNTQSLKMKE